ncbi:hypothetical protein ACFPRL_26480 [Pseudoclavibacter helvolus]
MSPPDDCAQGILPPTSSERFRSGRSSKCSSQIPPTRSKRPRTLVARTRQRQALRRAKVGRYD